VFDPKNAAKYKDCGISVLDAPSEILAAVLAWKGKDPNSQNPDDLKLAEDVLVSIRPYIRMITARTTSTRSPTARSAWRWLERGHPAVARPCRGSRPGHRGQVQRAQGGTIIWFDMYAIPADAPHPNNAHAFINFMMKPDVAAKNSNFVNYATGNAASVPMVTSPCATTRRVPAGGGQGEAVPGPRRVRGIHAPAQPHLDPVHDRQ